MLGYSFHHINKPEIIESKEFDLYAYRVYVGKQTVPVDRFNSYWYIKDNSVVAGTSDLPIESDKLCVEIIGYRPETRSSTFSRYTDLPYINGCSSKQLINPNRVGDPTWQMLLIPPFTSEQKHHIHSTVRVVYVEQGLGTSHIGASGQTTDFSLEPGMVLILDKMIPHHFSTQDSELIVLPLHVYSSTSIEYNHPMFNGTHKTE
jgi:hypothetical protein